MTMDEQENKVMLLIQNRDRLFIPCVPEKVTLELSRKGAPGTLKFSVLQDDQLKMEEGNVVQMCYGKTNLFKGFIFRRAEDEDGKVSVVAYDQLRYLKNKGIYSVVNKTASYLITQIADDFKLEHKKQTKDSSGNMSEQEAICDTQYRIPKMRASNETLFDIIQKALDHTLLYDQSQNNTKMYVLYDDFGVLTLKEVSQLDVPILIDAQTAQGFSFESSIDQDTYNQIILYEDNGDEGARVAGAVKDSANIARWGVLQKIESVNSRKVQNPQAKAEQMLKQFNAAKKSLKIKAAFGDVRVRAGSRIWIQLKVHDPDLNLGGKTDKTDGNGDTSGKKDSSSTVVQLLVENVKHTFEAGGYTMDLTLVGRGLTA